MRISLPPSFETEASFEAKLTASTAAETVWCSYGVASVRIAAQSPHGFHH
jgi:hypothetical protein